MTIHITWAGFFQTVGEITVGAIVLYIVIGLIVLFTIGR